MTPSLAFEDERAALKQRALSYLGWYGPVATNVANRIMARELVWLEDNTFAAWGCAACNWVLPNPGQEMSAKPPTQVKEEFNRHDCAKFPRVTTVIRKREGCNP
jgi:hypothetical protein